MKCLTAITLTVSVIVLLITFGPSTTEANGQWQGGCGSRLMDSLQLICGARGIKNMKMMLYIARYGRSRRYRHGRMKRDASDTRSYFYGMEASFSEERAAMAETHPSLSSIVKAGAVFNQERKTHARVRRQISTACCENHCGLEHIRRNYCNHAGRWKSRRHY